MSENFPTGEQRIRNFIAGAQAASRESITQYAEAEPIRMVQDRLWAQYNETRLAEYRDAWDKTLWHLSMKPMDDIGSGDRGAFAAYWNFESIVEQDNTQALVTTQVRLSLPDWKTTDQTMGVVLVMRRTEKKWESNSIPETVHGVKVQGRFVNQRKAREKLLSQTKEEFMNDAPVMQASVTVQALGHDQQPQELINTRVQRSSVDPEVGSRIRTFTPDGALEVLRYAKKDAEFNRKAEVSDEYVAKWLAGDLASYDSKIRPSFLKLNEINEILDRSH